MSYTFIDAARDTLEAVGKPLSIDDIWKYAVKLGYADKVKSTGKTPWRTLGARIYVDIKENANSGFVQVSKRPAKFYLKYLEDMNLVGEEKSDNQLTYKERDLHILLSTFVYSNPHFNCYTKTISHEKSKRNQRGYNKWLHPDMVGVYFPFDKFQSNILKLLDTLKENAYKLFSFEIKKRLNFGNLRQSYFQAVSNSSWAHEGYLVALEIEEDPLLIDEMRRLNNAFGIGIIKLAPDNIEESEILFSSRNTGFLDWETIDRLTDENIHFSNFIDDLMEDIKLGKVKSKYDKILAVDEYEDYIIAKNIKDYKL